ncbi:Crp/Fnr family transcriptional regulator [Notoacmeibacter sp. MSK16QG-6]|uniref:Crp/Fnr family transcriptional regulator n=1 Tax=Notoacmeibacter sp. MSK16QG-6 TaxID=2957982 RepID=UPI00209EFB4F|nr:Crp/Fnr family transcriptional regulator [Notoacmeibacter sp. MSK16QG-6]MCP1198648.1 Crp/Fnr family transcriptional regulator [Notoacmeibacter sp. MSK16QG-6]
MSSKRLDVHNSNIPQVCLACEARHRGVCGTLTPDQLLKLSKTTSKHIFAADDEMIPAGGEVRHYSNILSGVVKLTRLMSDGRQQIVGLQFAPDFLGRPFRNSSDIAAEAATEVRVCSFPKATLEELVREAPELEHMLHQQALKELDEAREWILTLGRKTAAEKVASFLYLIASHIDPEQKSETGPIHFELPLKRADIADFLGLTIETVSRQITKLRKSGVIELEGTRIVTVPSMKALQRASATDLE